VWALLDRASAGWRGFTMTTAGLRLLQDLRRTPHTSRPHSRNGIRKSHRNRRDANRFRRGAYNYRAEEMISMNQQAASAATPDAPRDPELTTKTAPQTPILITEQQVALATAAAVPVPSTTTRRWTEAIRIDLAAIRGMFATSTAHSRPARRHYPPRRTDFLEHSRMAREMHRL
jgi:hypothetical protein